MSPPANSSLDALPRRIWALLLIVILSVVAPAAIFWFFDHASDRALARANDFHLASQNAIQDALLVLDGLQMSPPNGADESLEEWVRQGQDLVQRLEQPLLRIVDLQRSHAWPEAAATVMRLQRQSATLAHARNDGKRGHTLTLDNKKLGAATPNRFRRRPEFTLSEQANVGGETELPTPAAIFPPQPPARAVSRPVLLAAKRLRAVCAVVYLGGELYAQFRGTTAGRMQLR